jgi:hypothetical protein
MSSNAVFLADVYFTLGGMNDTSAYHWEITASFSSVTTGWNVIPCIQSITGNTTNIYVLQGNITSNTLQLRIVRAYWNGINVGLPANITIVRREGDYSGNTYTLLSQVPYQDMTANYQIPLQGIQRVNTFNFTGQDVTSMGPVTFNWQPGQQIFLSTCITFDYQSLTTNSANTIFYINGVLLGFAVASTFPGPANNISISSCNIDLMAGNLLLAGTIKAGANILTVSGNSTGGTYVFANRWYNVTIICSF